MIITSVEAHNVLKYAELHLENLPAAGIIAISGLNESGKSTIGETICFALFGRTFSLGSDELDKVLRWGEDHCSVNVGFRIDDTDYQLARFLDRDGNHSARLSLAGEEEPIARGTAAVAEKLFDLLGYEFEEFVESFYLAQREITTPHPHSLAVKIMAGIAPIEYVSSEFEDQIDKHKEMLDELNAEIDSLDSEMAELGFEEGALVELEELRNSVEQTLRHNHDNIESLEGSSRTYIENQAALASLGRGRARARFLRTISLLLALVLGGAWALLTFRPATEQAVWLAGQLQTRLPQWRPEFLPYLGIAAAGLAGLMLLFWILAGVRSGRMRDLVKDSAGLARVMELARSISDTGRPEGQAEAGEAPAEGDEPERIGAARPERPDDMLYATLYSRVEDASATAQEVRGYADAELAWLRDLAQRQQQRIAAMNHEVDLEMDKLRQAARLQEALDALREKSAGIEAQIARRERAIELLEGASKHLSNNFNRDVRDLVSRTLPIFTQDRYEHLRIDEGLNVRVFSSEKRDFMDLEEISSGTQRQIMLALRLALSQKLMSRTVEGDQFAFLDEPFAFFDDERTRHALNALRRMGDGLSQIWIVAQTFPAGAEQGFAARIQCARDLDILGLQTS